MLSRRNVSFTATVYNIRVIPDKIIARWTLINDWHRRYKKMPLQTIVKTNHVYIPAQNVWFKAIEPNEGTDHWSSWSFIYEG